MILPRRGFLLGLASLIAAPAIVRIENIMPVRALRFSGPPLELVGIDGVVERLGVMGFVQRDGKTIAFECDIVNKILASQIVYVR